MPQGQDYSPEVAKLLFCIEEKVVSGLKHGFFEINIKCDIRSKGMREVVVQAGNKHKFNVPTDQVSE